MIAAATAAIRWLEPRWMVGIDPERWPGARGQAWVWRPPTGVDRLLAQR